MKILSHFRWLPVEQPLSPLRGQLPNLGEPETIACQRLANISTPASHVGLFKPSQVWEGGAVGDGWVDLQLPVEIFA